MVSGQVVSRALARALGNECGGPVVPPCSTTGYVLMTLRVTGTARFNR